MRKSTLVATALLLPLLAACERTGPPPMVTNVSQSFDSTGGAIIVQPGDTAYSLSRRFNVPLRDLLELNRLTPPYHLEVGQRLLLPGVRSYTVQRGDTLYGISRMFNVEMAELTRLNGLSAPYAVKTGQPLRLPGGVGGSPGGVATATVPTEQAPSSRGSVQVADLPPPGASPRQPAQVLTPPRGSGQGTLQPPPARPLAAPPRVLTPPAGAVPTYPTPTYPTPAGKPTAPVRITPDQGTASPVRPQPPPVAALPQAPVRVPVAAPAPRMPSGSNGSFLWPVRGKIISAYGPKSDGMHNDGINIAAAKGTAVAAAATGTVAYVGNELRGFGNLVLIKHANGFITAYAHLDQVSVTRGATVQRGSTIGTVGQTGSVSSPQLHFELRKGSAAIDPSDHMAFLPVSRSETG